MIKTIIRLFFILLLAIPFIVLQAQPAEADNQIYEFIEVDVKPLLTRDSQPVYPQSAIDAGVEGTVVVTIVIDENGNVATAEIFSSIPQLDNAALQAARARAYSPGQINGVAVSTRINIPIEFILPDVAPAPAVAETDTDVGDFVDLTGEAIRIQIEPEVV